MKKTILRLISLGLALTMISCAGVTNKERGAKTGVLVGTATGAILGQVIGRDTEATLIGAGVGAVVGGLAGHQIGAYMDKQEAELRDAMAASEAVNIQRNQDVLIATFKSDVFFDFDSASLKPGAYPELNRVATVLNKYPQTMIRVEGHTDSIGSEAYNQTLSERRAQSVKDALMQDGVNSSRIQTVGYGESQPVSSNNAANRRVSIVIIPIAQG